MSFILRVTYKPFMLSVIMLSVAVPRQRLSKIELKKFVSRSFADWRLFPSIIETAKTVVGTNGTRTGKFSIEKNVF